MASLMAPCERLLNLLARLSASGAGDLFLRLPRGEVPGLKPLMRPLGVLLALPDGLSEPDAPAEVA